ncbi:unnamed protein product [Xylocopa violacea]|uniref:C2H2-type domain-containing protein n=1 Tax=Xylocopa violacea TaxID=135666 RepID=A0ABP1NFW9_XYLVO
MYGRMHASYIRPDMAAGTSMPGEAYRSMGDSGKGLKDDSFLYVNEPIPSVPGGHWPNPLGVQNSVPRKKFHCPRCNSGYTRLSDMKSHCHFQCGKDPRYQCPYCTKKAKFSSNMYVHVRRMHKHEKLQIIDLYKQLSRFRY